MGCVKINRIVTIDIFIIIISITVIRSSPYIIVTFYYWTDILKKRKDREVWCQFFDPAQSLLLIILKNKAPVSIIIIIIIPSLSSSRHKFDPTVTFILLFRYVVHHHQCNIFVFTRLTITVPRTYY